MQELSVVGLDLTTGHEVLIDNPREVPGLRRRGYGYDETVVCVHCFDASAGRDRIPLIARGRLGGRRRAHFAHPVGTSCAHGYFPETDWHAFGKQHLARWARGKPEVAEATVEAWTCDGRRRSDVRVRPHGGGEIRLELQRATLPDVQWLDRHRDYHQLDEMADVWIWHPRAGIPDIVYEHGLPGWILSDDFTILSTHIALAHPRTDRWWTAVDLSPFGTHWPPHPGDRTRPLTVPLDELRIIRTGLALPTATVTDWTRQTRVAAELASRTPWAAPSTRRPLSARPGRPSAGASPAEHQTSHTPDPVVRTDAQPPHDDRPERRRYYCRRCNADFREPDLPRHRHTYGW